MRKINYTLSLIVLVIAVVYITLNNRGVVFNGVIESADRISINRSLTNELSNFSGCNLFDKEIERFMRKWAIKGCSFAIMKNDSLLYAKGYGYANVEEGVETLPGSLFRVASISKLITAAAIMKLAEDSLLMLNSKVFGNDGILNDTIFTTAIRDKKINNITVEHLLRHTAGFSYPLGDPAFNVELVARNLGKTIPLSIDDMVLYAAKNRLRHNPGGYYKYSNLGYIVLSKIIEKVSGVSYYEYIKRAILYPAGCYEVYMANNFDYQKYSNEVRYYEVEEAELVEAFDNSGGLYLKSRGGNDVRALIGAGGLVASAPELLRFVASINKSNVVENILSKSSIELMTDYNKNYKPIGWASVTSKEWTRSGSMSGTAALIKKERDEYTWVFISNTSTHIGPRFSKSIDSNISKAIRKVKWPSRDLFRADSANSK